MKKSILLASAALAALSFTSCNKEVDMFEPIGSEKATINLNITNDDAMLTRAGEGVKTADKSKWYAKIDTYDSQSWNQATWDAKTWVKANTLEGVTRTPGDFVIQVANYPGEAAAYANTVNDGAGDAYYTLTDKDITLQSGVNNLTFVCGTAKNARVVLDWDGTANVNGLTMTSVVATQTSKSRSYTFTGNGTAYFYAGVDIVCTINYVYNEVEKSIQKTITAPTAATQYAFNVSANSNGTITTLTITYNDTFGPGTPVSAEIDAATGNEVE